MNMVNKFKYFPYSGLRTVEVIFLLLTILLLIKIGAFDRPGKQGFHVGSGLSTYEQLVFTRVYFPVSPNTPILFKFLKKNPFTNPVQI